MIGELLESLSKIFDILTDQIGGVVLGPHSQVALLVHFRSSEAESGAHNEEEEEWV